jgi:hypothetical protein
MFLEGLVAHAHGRGCSGRRSWLGGSENFELVAFFQQSKLPRAVQFFF